MGAINTIHIFGFEDINLISFSMCKKVNSHSVCRFTFKSENMKYSDFLDKIGNNISIDNGDEFLFYGYIDNVSVETRFSETEITVHAVSCSTKSDCTKKFRIFQNPQKTLYDITEYIQKHSSAGIVCKCHDIISEPVLQHEETDFEFLARMAKRCGLQIFVRDTEKAESISFLIGKYSDMSPVRLREKPEKLSYHAEFTENFSQSKYIFLILREQFLDIGTLIDMGNEIFYVSEMHLEFERGVFKYQYLLHEQGSVQKTECQPLPAFVSLKAVTENNNDPESMGRIQVRFDCNYEDALSEQKIWIPCQIPYSAENGGIVFLPDKGDTVNVIYSDGTLTANQTTGNSKLSESVRNVRDKHIADIYGKKITFSENCLELSAGNNTIVITEQGIELQVNDTELFVSEKGIKIKTSDSSVNVEQDISIRAGNDVEIKGTKIYLK